MKTNLWSNLLSNEVENLFTFFFFFLLLSSSPLVFNSNNVQEIDNIAKCQLCFYTHIEGEWEREKHKYFIDSHNAITNSNCECQELPATDNPLLIVCTIKMHILLLYRLASSSSPSSSSPRFGTSLFGCTRAHFTRLPINWTQNLFVHFSTAQPRLAFFTHCILNSVRFVIAGHRVCLRGKGDGLLVLVILKA